MELRVLGSVRLRVHDHVIDLGDGKLLALAAALGIDGGRPVARETAIKRVFGDSTAATINTLNSYLSRIRTRLERAGVGRTAVENRAEVCRLRIEPEDVDWIRFRRLHAAARQAERAGQDRAALTHLEQAMALWEDEPLTGVSGAWWEAMRETMRREHRSVLEQWGRVALRVHPPEDVIGPVSEHAARYPLNEPITANLLLALHGAGRTAEAVPAYLRLRDRLAEEFATSPGTPLRRVYRMVLGTAAPPGQPAPDDGAAPPDRAGPDAGEAALPPTAAAGPEGPAVPGSADPVDPTDAAASVAPPATPQRSADPPRRRRPDHLDRDIADFSGRRRELEMVLAAARSPTPPATTVCVISGMPGVGKSTLAVHAGHLLRDAFPDARIQVELNGAREEGPTSALEALHALLTAVDVPADAIPEDLTQRAALWRDRTAGMRALLLLDDARDHEQVRWLLPSGPECVVLITSRHRMPELDGAVDVRLSVPGREEAIALFADVARQDPTLHHDRMAELVDLCENLPLALRLMAHRWRQHPAWTLADLVAQLRRARDRVAEIFAGGRSLEAVFALSLRGLSATARAAFPRLGLHPAPEFGTHAAAAVIGDSVDAAQRLLDELADASLVEEPQPRRYAMHALLVDFARRRAETEIPAVERHGVLHRAMDYHVGACAAADRARSPHRHRRAPASTHPVELPEFDTAEEATRWFDTERPVLLSVLSWARERGGFEAQEAALAHAMAEFVDDRGLWEAAVTMQRRAVEIERERGHPRGLAHALSDLSWTLLRGVDAQGGLASAEEALRLWREQGDLRGEALALDRVGLSHYGAGEHHTARRYHHQALALQRSQGDPSGVAICLTHAATCDMHLGDYQAAMDGLAEALEIYTRLGSVFWNVCGVGRCSGSLGWHGRTP